MRYATKIWIKKDENGPPVMLTEITSTSCSMLRIFNTKKIYDTDDINSKIDRFLNTYRDPNNIPERYGIEFNILGTSLRYVIRQIHTIKIEGIRMIAETHEDRNIIKDGEWLHGGYSKFITTDRYINVKSLQRDYKLSQIL